MENKEIEFQVVENWGDGCKGFEYFTINVSSTDDEIKKKAIEVIKASWENQKQASRITVPEPCKPTIKIREYANGKKVKNGIQLKTKWR